MGLFSGDISRNTESNIMLCLEMKKGPDGKPWVYFTTDSKREIDIALAFLQEHQTIMNGRKQNQMTVYDLRKKYEGEIG